MQTQKMSLANIKGKLSRVEMKNIMAGSTSCHCNGSVGEWYYTSEPTCWEILNAPSWCSSGSATCSGGCHF